MSKSTAQILRESRNAILREWEKRALQEVASAAGQTSLALRNSMSLFLDTVCEALSRGDEPTNLAGVQKQRIAEDFGETHGLSRVTMAHYSIDQVIYEYHILREVIFRHLEKDKTMEKRERDLIISMIEQSVNLSATYFSETLRSIREHFVSALAHDLKTPVTSTQLSAEMIFRKPGDAEFCKRKAASIIEAMHRLERMIADILDANRIGAGEKLDLKLDAFDMKSLLDEIVVDSNLRYGSRFELLHSDSVDGIWDQENIRRALENLVNNAAKYGNPNTLITLSLTHHGGRILLSVHNEGAPIPEEQQKNLFQQYRRLDRNRGQKGWGLGLLIVKGVVEAHGGHITVESREGKGTTFILDLPRWVQERPLPEPEKLVS